MIENHYVIGELFNSLLKLCISRENNYMYYYTLGFMYQNYKYLTQILFYIESYDKVQMCGILQNMENPLQNLSYTVNNNSLFLDKKRYVFYDKSININLI